MASASETLVDALRRSLQQVQGPGATSLNALEFLFILARLERLPHSDAVDLVQHAKVVRATDVLALTRANDAINPHALVEAADAVVRGLQTPVGWAEDLLMVAAVAPWLSQAKQVEAATAVEICAQAMVKDRPAFRGAAAVILARFESEPAIGLGATLLAAARKLLPTAS